MVTRICFPSLLQIKEWFDTHQVQFGADIAYAVLRVFFNDDELSEFEIEVNISSKLNQSGETLDQFLLYLTEFEPKSN